MPNPSITTLAPPVLSLIAILRSSHPPPSRGEPSIEVAQHDFERLDELVELRVRDDQGRKQQEAAAAFRVEEHAPTEEGGRDGPHLALRKRDVRPSRLDEGALSQYTLVTMFAPIDPEVAALRARRDRVLGAGSPLFYREPLHLVRGEGVHVFDADGRRYVDMYNNVPCVGHANPRVVEAMAEQQATLNVHSRYLHEGVIEYAERLVGLHADGIESVVFTCSGTEAIEVALLTARAATGGEGIICTDATYHGNSTEVRKMARARLANGPGDPSYRARRFSTSGTRASCANPRN